MSLRINHNISAINSHRNLIQNTKTQAKNLERLSSGLKINRGADAPAGLIISERLRAQVAGLRQAIDNSEAGISLMQTAEGALEEVNRALINIRQLAVASANEATNDEYMLEANQEEILNSLQRLTAFRESQITAKKQFWTEVWEPTASPPGIILNSLKHPWIPKLHRLEVMTS